MFGAKQSERATRWRDVWSAGHSVSSVRGVVTVAELVDDIEAEYDAAREATRSAY